MTTERYDRGMKFQHYRTIPSLQEYLLIAQDSYSIEHYMRSEGNKWILIEAIAVDSMLTLPSIKAKLRLSDVYEQVEFASNQSSPIAREPDSEEI